MITQPQPLLEVFAEIRDFRRCRGKRHPWPALLSLACCALLCGSRSESAIAAWGRHDGARIAPALGLTDNTPCAASPHTVFRHVDRATPWKRHGALGPRRSSSVHPWSHLQAQPPWRWMAKTLRGSRQQGAPDVPLLSALSPHLGLTLAPHAVDDKTNASTQVETVLPHLVLQGRGCTMDALLTQRHVAQPMVEKGGDYVMIVQEHQPQLRADLELVLTLPPPGDRQERARTVDIGHGRIELRHLTTSEALVGDSAWPGLAQVFEMGRPVITQTTGKERTEVVYGVVAYPDSPDRQLVRVPHLCSRSRPCGRVRSE